MNIEFLLAEADMAIERNQAATSEKGKYRADHHADLVTVCALLRDALKGSRVRAKSEPPRADAHEEPQETNDSQQSYADLNAGIIRARYSARVAR